MNKISKNKQASKREPHRLVVKRPWGRRIVVNGTEFMWQANYLGVIIRSDQGYHKVSSDTITGKQPDGWWDLSSALTPSGVANWIRNHLIPNGNLV